MLFYLESYGCTLNHGEAQKVNQLLLKAKHHRTDNLAKADFIIISTCTVIKTTELKMLRQIRLFTELEKPLIVSGCMAVVQQDDILNIKPDTFFLPPSDIDKIHTIIDKISEVRKVPDIEKKRKPRRKEQPKDNNMTSTIEAIIPISTGCRGKCSYCITRLARGALKSYSVEQIISDITESVINGHLEIRLTAQDTACYGYDTNTNLAKLLSKISELDTTYEFRTRVGMMNPDSVKPILKELITSYSHPRIFKFLHMPIQSGDDGLLRDMGRKYTVKEFMGFVKKFRTSQPKLTISTDIIVGYPTETQEQFQNTIELIKELKPNIINITRFSPRPGTTAYKLKNKIPGHLIKSRSRELTSLRFSISKQLNEHELGNRYQVLITEIVKPGTVLARNDNYLPIVIKEDLRLGQWVTVEILEATDSYLIGHRV